jgi:putative SOS response-associated peptidase YedK
MCGRYTLYGPKSRLTEYFDMAECADFAPRYNIAPQSDILVIRQHPEKGRVGVMHKWGLIPSWAKDPSIGAKLNNARAETVAEKPAFRSAFKRLRCLIPANGFYEWQAPPEGSKAKKQPFYMSPTDSDYFAFAGLVECWQPEGADRVLSVCIITTSPNRVMAPIHDRMPVIFPSDLHDAWLDHRNHDIESLKGMLAPAPDNALQAWPVSSTVSRSGNDGEELIRRLVTP